jgi:hypothetical protein
MRQQSDYSIIFLRFFFVAVCAVGVLSIYWMVAARFPNISIWGFIVVAAYIVIAFVVPTITAPFVSKAFDMTNYLAWRLVMNIWVASTAIVGLLAWPIIGAYIKPLFVGGGHAL